MSNRSGLLEAKGKIITESPKHASDSEKPIVPAEPGDFLQAQNSPENEYQRNMDALLENKLTSRNMDIPLTKREREILEFVIAGNTNREIAQKLYRTERTVEYHRNRIMRKLGTHTTVELIKRAIAIGIA